MEMVVQLWDVIWPVSLYKTSKQEKHKMYFVYQPSWSFSWMEVMVEKIWVVWICITTAH